MKTRVQFDVRQAIAFAWGQLWANNLANRAKGDDFRGNTYHLTASDVENQVRALAEATIEGRPWNTVAIAWGRGWSRVRMPGDLQAEVRTWLLRNPKIVGHNFGRGHVSGMRFRPAGEPVGPVEAKTLAKQAEERANPKPRRRHYAPRSGERALCVKARFEKAGRQPWGWRTGTWTTSKPEEVTCPACRNLLKARAPEAAAA